MIWATRRHCHVDRAACAWLIRRFVDPEPTFLFVDDPDEIPVHATPFDIRGAVLSHHDGDCSFETFIQEYALFDPALLAVARLVHEADLADDRYDAPEAAGIDVLIRALSENHGDAELLELTAPLFDALYAHFLRGGAAPRERGGAG